MDTLTVHPIGRVRREEERTWLVLDEPWRPGLIRLEEYSHLAVLWWFDQQKGRHADGRAMLRMEREGVGTVGIFATRSPHRPNPIALSMVKILGVDAAGGRVEIDGIEAYDNTALVDLKGYSPALDSIPDAVTPAWSGSHRRAKAEE